MLLNGLSLHETKSSNDMAILDNFLENEKNKNKIEQWYKLDKSVKIKKLISYAEKFKIENNLNDEQEKILISYFKENLNCKKLQRVKDVVYDKDLGIIKEVPGLQFNKINNNFTIKNLSNKHVSTFKSLTQTKKKSNVTIKNKENKPKLSDSDNVE
jgi:hypothetical protein